MKVHILGICGTFMGGLAVIAKQAGYEVSGSDQNVYPPMSTQLETLGIPLTQGFEKDTIPKDVDLVIVGNVIKRGMPIIEQVLSEQIPYLSGPEWLAKHVLQSRWVLAVSGTHGKTTTTSMLAWLLEYAGKEPGFLIGGVPENFGVSARLGESPYFVIEADEYDSAFFDKRSKFVHYRPKTLIMNNLEYDHADIFPDLAAIQRQFHHLVRTVPGDGLIVKPDSDANIEAVLDQGCWTPTSSFTLGSGDWSAELLTPDGSEFEVHHKGEFLGAVKWDLMGEHNVKNALAAIAAAHHVGVAVATSVEAFATFKNVKRRMEVKGKVRDVTIYDDFAHHPTAIATTLAGLRARIGDARLIAVVEFGSYTMRTGVHKDNIQAAFKNADMVVCKLPQQDWGLSSELDAFAQPTESYTETSDLVAGLVPQLKAGDHVLVMSNASFDGVHQKLLTALEA